MKKILAVTLILAVCIIPASDSFGANGAGTSSGQFLKLDIGARAAGMGGAFAGVSDDSTAMYWNPAGLNKIPGGTMTLMHASWFEGMSYDWLSFAQAVLNFGTIGIAAQDMSYGSIPKLDSTGLETGSMNPSDRAIMLSYGGRICGLPAGINLKYISSTIDSSASAYACDAGVMKGFMGDRLTLGAAVQNVGTGLKYVNVESPLPENIKLGGAYLIEENWLAALDVNAPNDNSMYFAAGTEYVLGSKGGLSFALRAGYNTRNTDTGGLNGVTAGLGVEYMGYDIDYAFVPYGNLGDTQRISLTVKFGYGSEGDKQEPAAAGKNPSKNVEQKPTIADNNTSQKVEQEPVVVSNNTSDEQSKISGNVAVAEFTGKNVSQADASIIADFLRTELVNTNKCAVVEKANMDKILAESSFQRAGCTTSECAIQIGKILNVKYMIVGSLSRLQGTYFITVSVVDVETGQIIDSYREPTDAAIELSTVCRKIAKKIVLHF